MAVFSSCRKQGAGGDDYRDTVFYIKFYIKLKVVALCVATFKS